MKLAVLLGLTTFFSSTYAQMFVCYYGSWSVYRPSLGKFGVEDIDPNLCTHLIYSFVGLNPDGTIKLLDPYNDIGDAWKEGAFTKLQRLRQINPEIKIIVAIGGWNEGSRTFSAVTNNPQLRSAFVENMVNFALKYKFDGFDIDWEYPNQRGGVSSDKEAFSATIQEAAEKFKSHGLSLSAAVSSNILTSPDSYNCPDLAKYLDFINIMSYDLHGSWERTTGHHTAMYPHPNDPEHSKHLNVNDGIQYWINCTGTPNKLNIGVVAYGRTFKLENPQNHYVGAPSIGPGSPGKFIPEPGLLGYNEYCFERKEGLWDIYDIPEQYVKYAVKNDTWLGLDDQDTITTKIRYAQKNNLGGVMIWSIETDDFRGNCGMGKFPLLKIVNYELFGSLTTQKDPVTSTETIPPASTNPSTTQIPPQVVDDYDKLCKYCGHIFQHPKYKSSFIMCTYGPGGSSLVGVLFKCPKGLLFSEEIMACTYP